MLCRPVPHGLSHTPSSPLIGRMLQAHGHCTVCGCLFVAHFRELLRPAALANAAEGYSAVGATSRVAALHRVCSQGCLAALTRGVFLPA